MEDTTNRDELLFQIVVNSDPEEVEVQVTLLLEEGWSLHGPLQAVVAEGQIFHVQALSRPRYVRV